MTIFLVFAGLILLLMTGIPIFAALGLAATAILLLTEGSITTIAATVYDHLDKPILTSKRTPEAALHVRSSRAISVHLALSGHLTDGITSTTTAMEY